MLETSAALLAGGGLQIANLRISGVAYTTLEALVGTRPGMGAKEAVWLRGAVACKRILAASVDKFAE